MKQMFNTRASVYYIAGVCLFAILFTVSCIDESLKPDSSDTKDKAEYELFINDKKLIGENIDSNWDSELGIVWLGTDENRLPTGTLTIFIDTIVASSGRNQAWISSAILSTADQLVGTGTEINAKTYHSLGKDELLGYGDAHTQWIDFVEIGANYISGVIVVYDDDGDASGGWLMKDTNTGEIATLFGTFTAIRK
jgi:hypothetical protein